MIRVTDKAPLTGLSPVRSASLVRALSEADGVTEPEAYRILSAWQDDEAGRAGILCLGRAMALGCSCGRPCWDPTDPAAIADVLLSYRWERVAAALAALAPLTSDTTTWTASSGPTLRGRVA